MNGSLGGVCLPSLNQNRMKTEGGVGFFLKIEKIAIKIEVIVEASFFLYYNSYAESLVGVCLPSLNEIG